MKRSQVHFVKETVEKVGAIADLLGQSLKGLFHLRTLGSLNHDDNVIVVAEFLQVLMPSLLINLVRADQVASFGVILEKTAGRVKGYGAAREGQDQHQPGKSAYGAD